MTFTTVWKDYEGATLEEAAAKMLRDDAVWLHRDGLVEPPFEVGENHGYTVYSWEWDGKRLRVNYR